MMDKYMQIDLNLPSQRVHGLGERLTDFTLREGAWTMWANGKDADEDLGKYGNGNSYGVHPFALVQTSTIGTYYGIFFRNSNAQSPILRFNQNGGSTL